MSKHKLGAIIAAGILMMVGMSFMIFGAINDTAHHIDTNMSRSINLIHNSEYPQCATEISISEDRINYEAFLLHAVWVATCEHQIRQLSQ